MIYFTQMNRIWNTQQSYWWSVTEAEQQSSALSVVASVTVKWENVEK